MRIGKISCGLLPVLALLPLASFLYVHLVAGVVGVDGGVVVDGDVVVASVAGVGGVAAMVWLLVGLVAGSGGVTLLRVELVLGQISSSPLPRLLPRVKCVVKFLWCASILSFLLCKGMPTSGL